MTTQSLRVVYDTNVFIQAFLNPRGSAGKCFELVREQEVMLCVSKDSRAEIETVLERPAVREAIGFAYDVQKELFLIELNALAYTTDPITPLFELPRDPSDEKIVDLAVSSDADFIVTWDRDLLDLMTGFDDVSKEFRQRFRQLKVVRPDEFLKIISETGLSLAP